MKLKKNHENREYFHLTWAAVFAFVFAVEWISTHCKLQFVTKKTLGVFFPLSFEWFCIICLLSKYLVVYNVDSTSYIIGQILSNFPQYWGNLVTHFSFLFGNVKRSIFVCELPLVWSCSAHYNGYIYKFG